MEVIAFQIDHTECYGCPYCIDLPPFFYDGRERRSLPEVDAASPVDVDVAEMLEGALSETSLRLPRETGVNAPIVQVDN